eukprot:SAG31_NODE_45677_length_258_cov_0.572327_2_plen_55_part_01
MNQQQLTTLSAQGGPSRVVRVPHRAVILAWLTFQRAACNPVVIIAVPQILVDDRR